MVHPCFGLMRRALKLLEERQVDLERTRVAELEVRKARHEMEKLGRASFDCSCANLRL